MFAPVIALKAYSGNVVLGRLFVIVTGA